MTKNKSGCLPCSLPSLKLLPFLALSVFLVASLAAGAQPTASSVPVVPTAPAPRAARRPPLPSVQEIRERLRQQQAERDELAQRQALTPWRQRADSPDQLAGKDVVLVRLANTMNLYRAVFTFTPGPGNTAAAVRVPLCWRGEQWIALPPGAWQATVAVGRAAGARAFRIPLAPLAGRPGEVFELILTGQTEQAVQELERAALKAAADLARHLQEPVKKE